MAQIFSSAATTNTLDKVAEQLSGQANQANTDVNDAITALKTTDKGGGADNPALLADLQHKINKWSVIYNINSTVTRSMKDLMQGILQKI
ncbi:type III secretion system needle filament subunit SctF [Photorhabdus luminescens]|uniref:EscF/YscF/HrpA family type III secretion system needle major subunit n=1 Tax=Photorhabdus luminescens subsp. sonorensis TaxID=1173677 RepID=A0A5C4RMS0_PHOLU|nr:type III secretion system needle filament subunit SctF [Photorhabdus luminescens]TNH45350.1 EscF/YscF/HrpA family type III secretion system needle major subunit [Photorhabdus luminescens subsp. sonorensis]